MQSKQTKRICALGLSFAVYLFPLIGPHTVIFLGELIWRELTRHEREPLWMAVDVGFAVVLQGVVFLLLYRLFAKPAMLRLLSVAVAMLFVAGAAEYGYLVLIPSLFLIDDDTAAETGDWSVQCVARGVGLYDVAHPTSPQDWSEFLVQAPDGSYKLMHLPGCDLTPLSVPQAKVQPGGRVEFVTGLTYFVPGHGVIFTRQETATGVLTWNHLFNDRITPIPGLHATAYPILSVDGNWVAWLEKDSVAIERLDGSETPLQVSLGDLKSWAYTLRSVDMKQERFELVSSERRVVMGVDGSIKSSDSLPLAWDVYRDDGPSRVSWNINGRSSTHYVLKGRSVNSAAMTPSGDLVAVSVATALNIGQIRDSMYVLRASDSAEVFRRYLPRYTRTPVYFPTDDVLVYNGDREVIALRVRR
jgi:hypothetical protein